MPTSFVVKNGSKMCSSTLGGMPMPVSVTIRNTDDSLPAGANDQPAAGRHRVAGVHRQVHQHLLELRPVAEHRQRRRRRLQHELDVLADQPAHQPPDLAHDDVDVEHFGPEHLLAAERQELPRQQAGAMRGPLDLVEILGAEVGRVERRRHELGIAGDDGQQVVEVVRDAAGEPADRLHLHRLRELFLGRFERLLRLDDVGHVARIDDREQPAVFGACNRFATDSRQRQLPSLCRNR